MRRFILTIAVAAGFFSFASAVEVSFSGSSKKIISEEPVRNTGLDALYVVYNTSELTAMTVSGVGSDVVISRYSNLGGGFAEEIPIRYENGNAIIDTPSGDMGYIVASGGQYFYFWVVNYSAHYLSLTGVSIPDGQECDNTRIDVTGNTGPIHYFSIDGRQCELSREIHIDYYNLQWDEATESFVQESESKIVDHIMGSVTITPPLFCSSAFEVSGDRFLEEWGIGSDVKSKAVQPNGIAVMTSAEQTNAIDDSDPDADASNMINTDTQGLGGSAPADLSFMAYVTDAVIHNEWQIASDMEFEYIEYRFNEQNLDYTFNEEGTYYVRFIGSNSDGSCEAIGETYTVGIGSSDLRIPNAFTPNEDGVNDVWKVGYRSLLSFSCTIFDRYGNQIIHFTDPTQGWDGKYKGKYVKPGVYFYVIEATGADGKHYKKGGDINIIKSKRSTNASSPTE